MNAWRTGRLARLDHADLYRVAMLRSTLLAAALGAGLAIAGPIDSLLSTSQHVLGGSQAAVRSPMTVLSAADVEADGHDFETVSLASLADHSLRIKKPSEPLCESAGVDQYSGASESTIRLGLATHRFESPSMGSRDRTGYLDISDNRHLWFWAFESREYGRSR